MNRVLVFTIAVCMSGSWVQSVDAGTALEEVEVTPASAVIPIGTMRPSSPTLPAQVPAVALDDGRTVGLEYGPRDQDGQDVSLVVRSAAGMIEARSTGSFTVQNATLATDGRRIAMAWEAERSDRLQAVFLRLYDSSLTPLTNVVQVSGSSAANRFAPAVAVDDRQVLVAFQATPPVTEAWQRTTLFARRFDWLGAGTGSAFRVDEPAVGDVERGVYAINALLLGSGEAVFAWLDYEGGEGSLGDVHFTAFDVSAPVPRRTLDETILGEMSELSLSQMPRALIGLTDGGYAVIWETASIRPRAQVFGEDHLSITEPFSLLQSPGEFQNLERLLLKLDGAALEGGGFVVSWTSTCVERILQPCPDPILDPLEDYFDGRGFGTFVRSFGADGQPLGPSRLLHPKIDGSQIGHLVPSARHLPGNRTRLASVPAFYSETSDGDQGFLRLLTPACAASRTTACVGSDERFRLEVRWRDFAGGSGRGVVQQQEAAWSSFSFFDPGEVDLVVKIIDARSFTDNHWIFFSSLSDVFFELSVLDTQSGLSRVYRNEPGTFASRGDTAGLPQIDPPEQDVVGPSNLSSDVQGDGRRSALIVMAALEEIAGERCVASAQRLCFFDRFAAEVRWTDFSGGVGAGQRLELSGDSQAFWFFDPSNPELTLKILDGSAINGKYWVFFGSLSNVAFSLEVTDLETGAVRLWNNSLGSFASVGHIEAFEASP